MPPPPQIVPSELQTCRRLADFKPIVNSPTESAYPLANRLTDHAEIRQEESKIGL